MNSAQRTPRCRRVQRVAQHSYNGAMAMILILAAALAIGWFWNDTLQARERVLSLCGRACEDVEVQFLDETVALKRLGLGRNRRGYLALRRTYQFEFSADGRDRWHGRAVLLGRKLEALQMERGEGVTILRDAGQARVIPFPGVTAETARGERHPR